MARKTDTFDLGRLALSSGEGRRLDLTVGLGELQFGGQAYTADPDEVPVRLDVSRMPSGYSFRLRYDLRLGGPCMRCLEDAGHPVAIDSREVDHPAGGDELSSPYADGDGLDIRAWVRDALVLELPTQIVCTDECRGLCAVCGENLNEAGLDHAHEPAPDPRWAKLGELRLE